MNAYEFTIQRIWEKKIYIIAAVCATIAVGTIFSVQEVGNFLNSNDLWDSLSIHNPRSFDGSTTHTSVIKDNANTQTNMPKFSIDEYLKYSSIDSLIRQQ